MSLSIVVAVLFSALLHAVWNSLAHNIDDRLVGFALIGAADAAGGAVMAAVAGLPPAGAWPFIIASAALHVVYNLMLLASYELGEFSQMYPLARGTSPWVVALFSVAVLGHALPLTELIGVLTVSAIVLWAQTSGALAPIAALRETSIVFGALIGAIFLGERLGVRRAVAAGVVLAGVLLISLPS